MATSPEGVASLATELPAPVEVAPVETAPIAEAPVEAAPSAEPVADLATETPAEEAPAAEEAAAETPAEGAEPAAEAKPEGEPEAKAFPTYEDWTVPEGMEMQTEQTGALNNIFGKHNLSQEAGQEIIDYGSGILRKAQEQMAQHQQEVWADTQTTWRKDCEKQFGNRYNTMVNDAKTAITEAVPNDKDRAALWDALNLTGAGNHPAVVKAFAAIGRRSRERGAPAPNISSTVQKSPAERRYGR